MNELLYKADVCIVEISHEVDHRLLEFTKLQKQWFKKLESYLDEESKKENLQATIQVLTQNFGPKNYPKPGQTDSWCHRIPTSNLLKPIPDPYQTEIRPNLNPNSSITL